MKQQDQFSRYEVVMLVMLCGLLAVLLLLS